jgi:antitoxin VapB
LIRGRGPAKGREGEGTADRRGFRYIAFRTKACDAINVRSDPLIGPKISAMTRNSSSKQKRDARAISRTEKSGADKILAIADRVSCQVKRPYVDHAELLYDENGLPK